VVQDIVAFDLKQGNWLQLAAQPCKVPCILQSCSIGNECIEHIDMSCASNLFGLWNGSKHSWDTLVEL
jgi:hypothetical protein